MIRDKVNHEGDRWKAVTAGLSLPNSVLDQLLALLLHAFERLRAEFGLTKFHAIEPPPPLPRADRFRTPGGRALPPLAKRVAGSRCITLNFPALLPFAVSRRLDWGSSDQPDRAPPPPHSPPISVARLLHRQPPRERPHQPPPRPPAVTASALPRRHGCLARAVRPPPVAPVRPPTSAHTDTPRSPRTHARPPARATATAIAPDEPSTTLAPGLPLCPTSSARPPARATQSRNAPFSPRQPEAVTSRSPRASSSSPAYALPNSRRNPTASSLSLRLPAGHPDSPASPNPAQGAYPTGPHTFALLNRRRRPPCLAPLRRSRDSQILQPPNPNATHCNTSPIRLNPKPEVTPGGRLYYALFVQLSRETDGNPQQNFLHHG
ncbi:hypothetical protein DFH27DRAFT_643466 [Peziza echinospora]|nr:hypothetical protein DFH27DRAFT_643466 [Peziza echinospora]